MTRKYHRSSAVKHPGGRAKGESIPGAAALVNHANRQEQPFLLAQTKPLKSNLRALIATGTSLGVVGSVSAPKQTLDELKFEGKFVHEMDEAELANAIRETERRLTLAEINVARAVAGRRLMTPAEYIEINPTANNTDLQAEAPAGTVNALPATESSVSVQSAPLRLGISRSGLVMTLPHDMVGVVGRLGRPTLAMLDDKPVVTFATNQTGYQWSTYKGDEHRITVSPGSVPIPPKDFPEFRLQPCERWLRDEETGTITIYMGADLIPAKRFSGRNTSKRSSRTNTAEGPKAHFGRKRPNSPEVEALDTLPAVAQPVEDILTQVEVTSTADASASAEQPAFGYGSVPSLANILSAEVADLRDSLRTLNDLKRSYGSSLHFSLDTTDGTIHARLTAEINL